MDGEHPFDEASERRHGQGAPLDTGEPAGTESGPTRTELLHAQAELRRLNARLDSTREGERRRVARELHDELQQTLAAIRMELGALSERLDVDDADMASTLAHVSALALSAMNSTRRIVNDLRPLILEDLGLLAALEALTTEFSKRWGLACHFDASDAAVGGAEASPELVTCIYRVAEELLNNVAQHAKASRVHVRLASTPERGLVLSVHDNGVGLKADARLNPSSYGLLSMQERLRAVGGALNVDSAPGKGTRVDASVPMRAAPLCGS